MQKDRKHGNDGKTHLPHRRARFSASTKGIRLTPELIEWANQEIARDPEETWSRMVRAGLNLLREERAGLIQRLAPVGRQSPR